MRSSLLLLLAIFLTVDPQSVHAFGGGRGGGGGFSRDGQGSEAPQRPDPFTRLDQDGSGELSVGELQAMFQERQERRGRGRRGGGRGRRGGMRGPPGGMGGGFGGGFGGGMGGGRRGPPPNQENSGEEGSRREDPRQQMIAEHDADGDGKLSEDERLAAAQAMLARLDQDGSGGVSQQELRLGMEARRQRKSSRKVGYLTRYDLDGDGQVTVEEVETVRARDQGR